MRLGRKVLSGTTEKKFTLTEVLPTPLNYPSTPLYAAVTGFSRLCVVLLVGSCRSALWAPDGGHACVWRQPQQPTLEGITHACLTLLLGKKYSKCWSVLIVGVKVYNKRNGKTATCERPDWMQCRDHKPSKGWSVTPLASGGSFDGLGDNDGKTGSNDDTVSMDSYNSYNDDAKLVTNLDKISVVLSEPKDSVYKTRVVNDETGEIIVDNKNVNYIGFAHNSYSNYVDVWKDSAGAENVRVEMVNVNTGVVVRSTTVLASKKDKA